MTFSPSRLYQLQSQNILQMKECHCHYFYTTILAIHWIWVKLSNPSLSCDCWTKDRCNCWNRSWHGAEFVKIHFSMLEWWAMIFSKTRRSGEKAIFSLLIWSDVKVVAVHNRLYIWWNENLCKIGQLFQAF